MRTINFSRHNTLLCVYDDKGGLTSLDIEDTEKCRAHYTVLRSRGRTKVHVVRVETEDAKDCWIVDDMPRGERAALKAHIERLYAEDAAEDGRNVRDVTAGWT